MFILIGAGVHNIIHLLQQLKAVKETMLYTKQTDKYNYFFLEIFHRANREIIHVQIIAFSSYKIFKTKTRTQKQIGSALDFLAFLSF